MFKISIGEYQVTCQVDGLPDLLSEYKQRAKLSEEFGTVAEPGASVCFVSVGHQQQWPILVVVQHFAPAGCGFHPGVLLVPESNRLFIGAGRRLLGYDLSRPERLWEDEADCGFWSWHQHQSVILMSAELELAAWNVNGGKLWSRFVEPPWDYEVTGEMITLNVMDTISHVHLLTGESMAI